MGCKAIQHLLHIFKKTPSIKELPASAKDEPFPCEVKMTLLNTNPVFLRASGITQSEKIT